MTSKFPISNPSYTRPMNSSGDSLQGVAKQMSRKKKKKGEEEEEETEPTRGFGLPTGTKRPVRPFKMRNTEDAPTPKTSPPITPGVRGHTSAPNIPQPGGRNLTARQRAMLKRLRARKR